MFSKSLRLDTQLVHAGRHLDPDWGQCQTDDAVGFNFLRSASCSQSRYALIRSLFTLAVI